MPTRVRLSDARSIFVAGSDGESLANADVVTRVTWMGRKTRRNREFASSPMWEENVGWCRWYFF
jgi:hypothetical protein